MQRQTFSGPARRQAGLIDVNPLWRYDAPERMEMKKLAILLAIALLLLLAQTALAQGSVPPKASWNDPALRSRVEPALLRRLIAAQPTDQVPMIVTMRAQVGPITSPAAMVSTLQQTAEASQANVTAFLNQE